MKRKNYDEKKNTIIVAANKFFIEKGYEKTSVDDIIKKLKISKGTFYHYFNSKIELLNSIIRSFSNSFIKNLIPIIENDKLNAIEKLNGYFSLNQKMKSSNRDIIIETINAFYKDENILYLKWLDDYLIKSLTPYLSKILQQGIKEDRFKVINYNETAILVIHIGFIVRDRIIQELFIKQNNSAEIENCIITYQRCIENMLGIQNDSLILFPSGYFKQFSLDFLIH